MPSTCLLHSSTPILKPFSLFGYDVNPFYTDDTDTDGTDTDDTGAHAKPATTNAALDADTLLDADALNADALNADTLDADALDADALDTDNINTHTTRAARHVYTLIATIPDTEAPAVIANVPTSNLDAPTSSETTSRLDDLLLLLSLAHGHDIVRASSPPTSLVTNNGADVHSLPSLHHYSFGRVLAAGLRLAINTSESSNRQTYVRLEHCYTNIQTPTWQRSYQQGHYLRLVQNLAQQTHIAAAVNHAWLLLEHLFSLHNAHWLTPHHVRTLSPLEKLSFLVSYYVLGSEDTQTSQQSTSAPLASNQQRLKRYAQVLHQLVYQAHVPSGSSQAALSFISLVEYCCLAALYDTTSPDALADSQQALTRFQDLRQFEDTCRDPVALARHLHADNTELVTSSLS